MIQFKVTRDKLIKALLYLEGKLEGTEGMISQQEYNRLLADNKIDKNKIYIITDIDIDRYINYISEIKFALQETTLNEFYIDYEFAKTIKSVLK